MLRELHRLREEIASERAVAPFRVLTNEAMLESPRALPDGGAAIVPARVATSAASKWSVSNWR